MYVIWKNPMLIWALHLAELFAISSVYKSFSFLPGTNDKYVISISSLRKRLLKVLLFTERATEKSIIPNL